MRKTKVYKSGNCKTKCTPWIFVQIASFVIAYIKLHREENIWVRGYVTHRLGKKKVTLH